MGAKSLLIGLDALGPATADHMIAAGVAPVLRALKNKSALVSVENYPGMGDGVFWPSTATGLGPAGHGRYFHRQFDSRNYEVKFRDDADHFDVESFWKRLDRHGNNVAVIDWPRMPVEDMENGFILDNWLGHDPVGPLRSRPASIAESVIAEYGADPWGGGACTWDLRTVDDVERFVKDGLRRIDMKTRFCVSKLHESDWALFAPVFSEPHDFGHYLWHISDPDHPRHDPSIARAVGDPILQMGAALDRACAQLIDAAGPGAVIMVLAGPGMAALMTATPAMEEITRQLDLGKAAPLSATEKARMAYRKTIPPWIRGRASPIIRRFMRPSQHSELARRRFFSVPHNAHAGCIRFNVKGREPYGVVEPGEEYESLAAALTRDLLQLCNADTGAPIVQEVSRTRGVYDGAHADSLPDLFVIWRRDAHFSRIMSPKVGVIEIGPHPRTGDHIWDGFFWICGPSARPQRHDARASAPHELQPLIWSAVISSPAPIETSRV